MVNIYTTQGMIDDKVRDIIWFEQSKWLLKFRSFNTQKRNEATIDSEKVFDKLFIIAFFGQTMEKV